jgi:hypothetical protein
MRAPAAEVNASLGAVKVMLQADPPRHDETVEVSVLRQLIGQEVRELMRQELKEAMAEQSSTIASMLEDMRGESGPVETRVELPPDVIPELCVDNVWPSKGASDGDTVTYSTPFHNCHDASAKEAQKKESAFPFAQEALTAAITSPGAEMHRSDDIISSDEDDLQLGVGQEEFKSFAELVEEHLRVCVGPARCVSRLYHNMGVHEAPLRRDPISCFTDSNVFAFVINVVIAFNCVFMWISANDAVANYKTAPNQFVITGERIFIGAYSFEFICKIIRYRAHYFIDPSWKYNWLDTFLLALSIFFQVSGSAGNVAWLRMLRILKIVKVVRVFRLVAQFRSLKAILVSLMTTLGTLGWSILMLAVIHFLFGLVIVLRVADYMQSNYEDGTSDPVVEGQLDQYFGSVEEAMLSLFGTSTGGEGWPTFFDVLWQADTFSAVFLLFFVFFSQIAILNIILGIFVDNAMKAMEVSKEEAALEHADEQLEIEKNIRELCHEADAAGNGVISRSEWTAALRKGQMQSYLDLVGVRVHNVMAYFKLLTQRSQDGTVDIDTFVRGCMRMKGQASGFDMQQVLHSLSTIQKSLDHIKR